MISFENMKITRVDKSDTYWDNKKKKHLKLKTPKITKKVVYEGEPHCIGDIYKALDFTMTDQGEGYYNDTMTFNLEVTAREIW
jgi:hypothetical protein